MSQLQELLENNRKWAEGIKEKDPDFFARLSRQQNPEYLWIGCSDSRVPANQIVDVMPGEVFVHRNIANLVQTSDLNCLSVIQFAVEVIGVKHIIVCGHYGCGGVLAAMGKEASGLVDYWIWNIRLTRQKHDAWFARVEQERQADVLCELNVIEQTRTLSQNKVIQRSWQSGSDLQLHGWIYSIHDGRLRDLGFDCGHGDDPDAIYDSAVAQIKDG